MTNDAESEIIHRQLETDTEQPALQIIEAVADIEDTDPTELPTLYECVDGMISGLFSNPPAPEAQLQLKFSYHTYRITIDQDGYMKLVTRE